MQPSNMYIEGLIKLTKTWKLNDIALRDFSHITQALDKIVHENLAYKIKSFKQTFPSKATMFTIVKCVSSVFQRY